MGRGGRESMGDAWYLDKINIKIKTGNDILPVYFFFSKVQNALVRGNNTQMGLYKQNRNWESDKKQDAESYRVSDNMGKYQLRGNFNRTAKELSVQNWRMICKNRKGMPDARDKHFIAKTSCVQQLIEHAG